MSAENSVRTELRACPYDCAKCPKVAFWPECLKPEVIQDEQ